MARRGYRATPRQLSEVELAYIENYTPRSIPARRWADIADVVRDAVRRATPHGNQPPESSLRILARHVDYCVHIAGMPQELEELLDADVIAYTVTHGLPGYGSGSRATTRSRLLWLADQLLPNDQRMVRLERIGRNPANEPYTSQQQRQLRDWASAQPTPYKRHACWSALAFGLGAGLRTRELSGLRREDVVEDEHGVLVHVKHGSSPRTVPMLGEWEDYAVVLAECVSPGALVFKSERNNVATGEVSSTLGHSKARPAFGVTVARMRHTWLVRHLNAGVPLNTLIDAAGVQGLTAFERLTAFLDPVRAEDVRDAYRAECNQRHAAFRKANPEYARALSTAHTRRRRAAIRRQVVP